MLPQHLSVIRHPVRADDLQASMYGSFVEPLKKLGFRPHQTVLVFCLGHMRPLGAYRFVHKDGRRVFLYFSRVRPFRFVVRDKKARYASPFYETFAELEYAFCQYCNIPAFPPTKMTVPTWPIKPTKP
jgi:hypothetical protein